MLYTAKWRQWGICRGLGSHNPTIVGFSLANESIYSLIGSTHNSMFYFLLIAVGILDCIFTIYICIFRTDFVLYKDMYSYSVLNLLVDIVCYDRISVQRFGQLSCYLKRLKKEEKLDLSMETV